MIENTIYKLQKELNDLNIELIFSGTFSQGLIEELGDALKQRLIDKQVTKSKVSTVFFTFIELAQNIKNYFASKESESEYVKIAGSGVIAITRTEQGFCVNSGNIILKNDINEFKEQLDKVFTMDNESLNILYKEAVKNDIDKETGRAGLGLVQIARKSSRPISYSFERIDDDYYFYNLSVNI